MEVFEVFAGIVLAFYFIFAILTLVISLPPILGYLTFINVFLLLMIILIKSERGFRKEDAKTKDRYSTKGRERE